MVELETLAQKDLFVYNERIRKDVLLRKENT